MDILFFIPPAYLNNKNRPVDRVYGCNYGYDYKPAIHLLSLATIAKNMGQKVRFLDCPAEGYNKAKFNLYLKKNNIDLVVFFSVWLSKQEDLSAAEIISGQAKGVKFIFTGSYPTWKPELFLKNNNYFVIRGEPENSFTNLINSFPSLGKEFSLIKGLSFLGERGVINNGVEQLADINRLPIPDRRLLRGEYYFNRINSYPATAMCVSRGCSYRCSYCAPQALDQATEIEYLRFNLGKPPLRLKEADEIIEEFKEIASLGYRGVEIIDNQFLWDTEAVVKICKEIKYLGLEWICYARADHIKDKNMLHLMRDAGCSLIYIGTESFVQEILDDVNKKINLAENYRAVSLVKECGIRPEASVLLGASGLETKETALHSIAEARRLRCDFVHYSIASALPNTEIYRVFRKKGWVKDNEFIPLDNTQEGILDLPHISAGILRKIIKRCYLRQYLSLGSIARQVSGCRSIGGIKYKIKALLKFLRYNFSGF